MRITIFLLAILIFSCQTNQNSNQNNNSDENLTLAEKLVGEWHNLSLKVEIQGDNANHLVNYDHGVWNCDCEEFRMQGVCAHVMATEKLLGESVELARTAMPQAA